MARWLPGYLLLTQLALAGAIFAVGVPATLDARHELAFRKDATRLVAAPDAQGADLIPEAGQISGLVPRSAVEQKELAFALLARADRPGASGKGRMELLGRSSSLFRSYLALVPADGAAWVGLASVENALGDSRGAVRALKASILNAPWSAALVLGRCGLGIDLFRALDDEGWEMMKGQFRLAAQRSAASLSQVVIAHDGTRIARVFLAQSPDELVMLEAELAKRR